MKSVFYHGLLEIDTNLKRLVKHVELLPHVNPTNAKTARDRFFSSKYTEDPVVSYRKIKFDTYQLQRLLFSLRIDKIKNPEIQKLYHDSIYYYSNVVQSIASIGKSTDFYFNSLRVFRTPTEKDVVNAMFILHVKIQNLPLFRYLNTTIKMQRFILKSI